MSSRLFKGFNLSVNYAKYRVSPPQQLIEAIVEYLAQGSKTTGKWNAAVDVGCGSGQATRLLAPYFERVHGFDVSETQIKEAIGSNTCSNVEYKVAVAESMPVKDKSVQLIAASEAAHFFNLPKFYKEVERVSVSNGVLAIFGYKFPRIYSPTNDDSGELNYILGNVYNDPLLSKYTSSKARSIMIHGYEKWRLPFKDFKKIENEFSTTVDVSVEDIMGLIRTFSNFNECLKHNPHDADAVLKKFKKRLKHLLGQSYSRSVSPAESLPLNDKSVNLVVASVAAHYFDRPKFYEETERILQEN
ncbi:putative methyltransferase-like protein, partial [Leptotrombidium deliense]